MSRNQKLVSVMTLAALVGMLVLSSPLSAALILSNGGFDGGITTGPFPATPFMSPLGAHPHSAAHNTGWTVSGGHGWAAGVNTPAWIEGTGSPGVPDAPSSPNVAWMNSGGPGTQGTHTQTLGGTMDALTRYTLSFDMAVLTNGAPDMTTLDLVAIVVGSVDGTLAQVDFAEDVLAGNTWYADRSLSWDSTGLDLLQTVTIAIGANMHGVDDPRFVIDDVTLDSAPVEPSLPGDLNSDGFVGQDDLNFILGKWGTNVTAGSFTMGDPSGDGFVGQDDLNILLGHWGEGTPPLTLAGSSLSAAAVPEPHSVLLWIVGMAALLPFWRRRSHGVIGSLPTA